MRPSRSALAAFYLFILPRLSFAYQNYSRADLLQPKFSILDDRPDGCPPCPSCFDCNKEVDTCIQYASCNKYNGKCSCPPGFGGDDCSQPLCGSLADGKSRLPRGEGQRSCDCKEGWEGINCNVCETDRACNALMPEHEGGVCYKQSAVVKQNYQMCNVTNRKILDQLNGQIPQVTFSCNAVDETCSFQCKQRPSNNRI